MRNLKLIVTYDGTDYGGWQTQANAPTIQATLEKAFQTITCEKRVHCVGSGRTDAGVHALGQAVNAFTATPLELPTLLKAINSQLPADIAVLSIEEVRHSFCAIKDAIKKRYRYVIDDSRIPDPFLRRTAWQPQKPLDAAAMHRAAQCLKGRHDFRSFETNWPNRLSSIRTMFDITVTRHDATLRIEVEADGFLYNMVRSIVGTLYQVGRGYWPEAKVNDVLEAMDRREAGPTAPPQGLFMLYVTYA